MAALTFKVGGDVSGLSKSLAKGRGMLTSFAGAAAKVGKTAVFAGMTASIAGLTASVAGLKKAIDLGGAMSDLSARTGIAVRDLVVLQRAFEDNGLSGEKVGGVINKLQKSINDAGNGLSAPKRALDAMGLSFDKLAGKTPLEQFEMVQNALAGMRDQTLKTGAAMDLFGRSGGELLTLFADAGAIGKAEETVGDQAEILERNAAAFDRTSDLLKSAWSKFTGFFVGMADYINPVLLPMLEEMNKLDLAKQGQAIGRAVQLIAKAFETGALPELLKNGLIVAGQELINFLVKGFRGLVSGLIAGLKAIPAVFMAAMDTLSDPKFWDGLGDVLVSLGKMMAVAFMELIPESLRPKEGIGSRNHLETQRIFAETDLQVGVRKMAESSLVDFISEMSGAMKSMGEAFREEMAGNGPIDTSGRREQMNQVIQGLNGLIEVEKKKEENKTLVPGADDEMGGGLSGFRTIKPIVSSLAKVGGAMGAGVIRIDLDKERNGLLKRIERNTRNLDMTPRWG